MAKYGVIKGAFTECSVTNSYRHSIRICSNTAVLFSVITFCITHYLGDCASNQFKCNNGSDDGYCIDSSKTCNRHPECYDGEDEKLCGTVQVYVQV